MRFVQFVSVAVVGVVGCTSHVETPTAEDDPVSEQACERCEAFEASQKAAALCGTRPDEACWAAANDLAPLDLAEFRQRSAVVCGLSARAEVGGVTLDGAAIQARENDCLGISELSLGVLVAVAAGQREDEIRAAIQLYDPEAVREQLCYSSVCPPLALEPALKDVWAQYTANDFDALESLLTEAASLDGKLTERRDLSLRVGASMLVAGLGTDPIVRWWNDQRSD